MAILPGQQPQQIGMSPLTSILGQAQQFFPQAQRGAAEAMRFNNNVAMNFIRDAMTERINNEKMQFQQAQAEADRAFRAEQAELSRAHDARMQAERIKASQASAALRGAGSRSRASAASQAQAVKDALDAQSRAMTTNILGGLFSQYQGQGQPAAQPEPQPTLTAQGGGLPAGVAHAVSNYVNDSVAPTIQPPTATDPAPASAPEQDLRLAAIQAKIQLQAVPGSVTRTRMAIDTIDDLISYQEDKNVEKVNANYASPEVVLPSSAQILTPESTLTPPEPGAPESTNADFVLSQMLRSDRSTGSIIQGVQQAPDEDVFSLADSIARRSRAMQSHINNQSQLAASQAKGHTSQAVNNVKGAYAASPLAIRLEELKSAVDKMALDRVKSIDPSELSIDQLNSIRSDLNEAEQREAMNLRADQAHAESLRDEMRQVMQAGWPAVPESVQQSIGSPYEVSDYNAREYYAAVKDKEGMSSNAARMKALAEQYNAVTNKIAGHDSKMTAITDESRRLAAEAGKKAKEQQGLINQYLTPPDQAQEQPVTRPNAERVTRPVSQPSTQAPAEFSNEVPGESDFSNDRIIQGLEQEIAEAESILEIPNSILRNENPDPAALKKLEERIIADRTKKIQERKEQIIRERRRSGVKPKSNQPQERTTNPAPERQVLPPKGAVRKAGPIDNSTPFWERPEGPKILPGLENIFD